MRALTALAISAGLVLGCQDDPSPAPPADAGAVRTAHVLDRTGYGPDPWSRERIEALGIEAYIEEQLDPASIDDSEIDAFVGSQPVLGMAYHDLVDAYPLGSDEQAVPLQALMHAKLRRAVKSRRQLEQVLVDFWFDHFNVYARDAVTIHDVVPYERDAIRPHVFGRFEDMLLAVARSPAMLYYLDNFRSAREGFVFEEDGFMISGLNENYARELLELHTVGVDGGYDQQDVIEVARIFTGWMIGPRLVAGADGFFFWAEAHDTDPKTVMGEFEVEAGGGVEEGEQLLVYLARHPKTAEFLCRKLAVRFVDESPPHAVVERCMRAYLDAGGHLGAATRAVLTSPEFLDVGRAGGKVKRPLHFVASMARATGMDLDAELRSPGEPTITLADGALYYLELLGEPLYAAHPPTGFADESPEWSGAGGLVTRFNLAWLAAQADEVVGIDWGVDASTDAQIVDGLADRLLATPLAPTTRSAALEHLDALPPFVPASIRIREAGALLLASPDFMRH